VQAFCKPASSPHRAVVFYDSTAFLFSIRMVTFLECVRVQLTAVAIGLKQRAVHAIYWLDYKTYVCVHV